MSLKLVKCNSLSRQSGFTITEISIVVIFIITIIMTVLGGMTLYDKGKIKMQISQLKQYKYAYESFKLEYNAIPGDYALASKKWAGVLNGDGNGRINEDATTVDSIRKEYEMVKFFEHLYLSNFIAENFYNSSLLNIGFPAIKLDSSMGMLAYGSEASSLYKPYQISKNTLQRFNVALGLNVSQPQLGGGDKFNDFIGTSSPAIYSEIDQKIDDGNSREGMFLAHQAINSTQGSCLSGIDGDYYIQNNNPACMAFYIIDN